MSEKKQLNEEQLEKVTGGANFSNTNRSAYAEYKNEMDCNNCVKGEYYLLVSKSDPDEWIYGYIYNTYRQWALVEYIRKLDIVVTDGNKVDVTNSGGTKEFTGEFYHVYSK